MQEVLKRILLAGSQIATGAFLLWLANNIFDWVLYPAMMCNFGTVKGAVMMAMLSIPFNYYLIRGYDMIGHDLLGIEALKRFESTEHDGKVKRLLRRILAHGRFGTFLFLSLYDPIPATLYMRAGTHRYRGLVGNDWIWFAVSTIVANVGWTVLMMTGVIIAEQTVGACAL